MKLIEKGGQEAYVVIKDILDSRGITGQALNRVGGILNGIIIWCEEGEAMPLLVDGFEQGNISSLVASGIENGGLHVSEHHLDSAEAFIVCGDSRIKILGNGKKMVDNINGEVADGLREIVVDPGLNRLLDVERGVRLELFLCIGDILGADPQTNRGGLSFRGRDERVHLRDSRLPHLRRVIRVLVDGRMRVPARRVSAPSAAGVHVVEEPAPEGIDGDHGRVSNDDQQGLRTGDGHLRRYVSDRICCRIYGCTHR